MGTLIRSTVANSHNPGGEWVLIKQARRQASAWTSNGGYAAIEQPHKRQRCAVRIKIKTITLYVSKQYIEDSVGNNVSLYIVAGGLPAYTSDEVKNIYENSESGRKKSLASVEWMTVNGTGFNVEGLNWVINKVEERLSASMNKLKGTGNFDNAWRLIRFEDDLYKVLQNDDPILTLDYLLDNILESNEESSETRGDSTNQVVSFNYYIVILKIILNTNSEVENDLNTEISNTIKGYDIDDDSDHVSNTEEEAFGTRGDRKDTDGDGLEDWEETKLVIFRTNAVDEFYDYDPNSESGGKGNADGRLDYRKGTAIAQLKYTNTVPTINSELNAYSFSDCSEKTFGYDPNSYEWSSKTPEEYTIQFAPPWLDSYDIILPWEVVDSYFPKVEVIESGSHTYYPYRVALFNSNIYAANVVNIPTTITPLNEYKDREIYYSEYVKGTDPNNPDTDGDGFNDDVDPYPTAYSPPEFAFKDELILTWPTESVVIYQELKTLWEPMWVEMTRNAVNTVTVKINVNSATDKKAVEDKLTQEGIALDNVVFNIEPLDSVWVRDYGPNFVFETIKSMRVLDWKYESNPNGPYARNNDEAYPKNYASAYDFTSIDGDLYFEGGNFQTDGNGIGYTSDVIYTANSGTATAIENELKEKYGLSTLRVLDGLENDGTKHIDMYVYIASATSVIVADFPTGDKNEKIADDTAESFKTWGYTVYRVNYLPTQGTDTPDDQLDDYIISYTNGLCLNDIVFVPQYNDKSYDDAAINVFTTAFPGKTVIGIDSSNIISSGGTIHCTTMTRPDL